MFAETFAPVLAFVLNLLIMIAGAAAFQGVEIRELPNVDQPVVTITTTYQGATPTFDISSYEGSVQYDLILEKKDGKYTLRRK